MIKFIKNIAQSEKLITLCFSLFLILFPFGSRVFSFSIGFMTIYPSLLLLLFLSFSGLFNLNQIKYKLEKYALFFLTFWFFYAFIFYFLVEGKPDALIDIRSTIMMGLTVFVFIWVKNFIGVKKWMSILSFSFQLIFFLLIITSIFELKTGIHFAGEFTKKIALAPISVTTYAPVFLFDNPNTLTSYVILLGLLIIITTPFSQKNNYFILLIISLSFFISYCSSARLGDFASYFFAMWFFAISLLKITKKPYWNKHKSTIKLFLIPILFLLACILTLPKYIGPIWQPKSNEIKMLTKQDDLNENSFVVTLEDSKHMNKSILEKSFSSPKIRYGLLLNGLEMIKNSNLLGVGPGQHRFLHTNGKVKYYTSTNIGPHFWLIEIISQYGALIFIGYIALLLWIFIYAIKIIKKDFYLASLIIIGLIIFMITSLLPSGFLILDINWIFTGVLVGVAASLPEIHNKNRLSV